MDALKQCLAEFIDLVDGHKAKFEELKAKLEIQSELIASLQSDATSMKESIAALQARVGECKDSEDDWWDWFRGKLHGDKI
jgi:chromosome segregation ATPase